MSSTDSSDDSGFTLIEVLITIVIIGIVAAVLGAVFSVIVRSTPTQAERADDARSLLGLTTWLPRDVGSTAEEGFLRGAHPAPCSGVPASQGLLQLQWSSGQYPSGDVYSSSYRLVDDDATTGSVVRFTCVNGGAAQAITMTASLQKFTGAQSESPAPVDITLEPTTTADGNAGFRGLQFDVLIREDDGVTLRELISLDAFTANVYTTLPPTTTSTTTTTLAGPNLAPTALDLAVSVDLDVPASIALLATDPETDPLTISAVTPPAGGELALTPGAGLNITILADSLSGAVGGQTYTFTFDVQDTEPLTSNSATVTVIVNNPTGPTTTSTTSTTTTLPPACVADFEVGNETNPSSISIKNNGTLQNDLTINITTNGFCTPLVVTFDPMPNDSNMTPESIAFGATTSITINKNAYTWDDGESSFEFLLREGANGTIHDTHNVGVN